MKKPNLKLATLGAAITSAFSAAPYVAAQENPDNVSGRLEEVIVTARKRDETLQDVPVTVTAFGSSQIQDQRIDSVGDLSAQVPGFFAIDTTDAAPQGTIRLRGVSTGAVGVGSDQTIAINIDGVQVENPFVLRAGQIDLQQIEILKGPQALFFGKNVSGGVVAIKTADPTDELLIKARLGHEFNAEETFGEFVVSGPLTDTLGARAVLHYTTIDGWVKNNATRPVADRTGPDYDEVIGRLTLKWEPTDNFDARLKVSQADRDGRTTNISEKVDCPDPERNTSDCTLNFENVVADAAPETGLSPPLDASEATIVAFEMNWDLSDVFSVASTTGFYNITDHTRGTQFITDTQPGAEVRANIQTEFESLSQELRLTSDFDGRFNFMIGAFADSRSAEQNQSDFVFGAAPPPIGDIRLPATEQELEADSYSWFVQGIYDITDTLELSGGVRYVEEEKTFQGIFSEDFDGALPPTFAPVSTAAGTPIVPSVERIIDDDLTPELTLSWKPIDEMSVFVAYKEGFKSGSFDIGATNSLLAGAPPGAGRLHYDPESAKGGEVGIKSTWLDNSLRINATAYSYTYDNLQVSSIDLTTGFIGTINSSTSKVEGIEVDLLWAPEMVDGLTITAALNYNDAKYTDDFFAECNSVQTSTGTCPLDLDTSDDFLEDGVTPNPMNAPTFQNLKGTKLQAAPEWAGNIGFTYEQPVGFSENMGYRFGLNAVYSDSYTAHANNDLRATQDSYSLLNGSVALYSDNSGWEVALIGRNLTDEAVAFAFNDQPLSAPPGEAVDINALAMRSREIVLQLSITPSNW